MITFFFSTYAGDESLARRLVGQIQHHHPDSLIVAIADGYDPELPGVLVHTCQQPLKRPGTIHEYSYNRLKVAFEASPHSDLFIQMDPDTYLFRPFRRFPNADWFGRGSIERYGSDYTCRIILGCCWGMRRALIERLVRENPFAPELYDYPGNVRPDGTAFEDLGFALAVDSIYPNHLWQNWGEVNVRGKISGQTAAAHPIKELEPRIKSKLNKSSLPALRPINP